MRACLAGLLLTLSTFAGPAFSQSPLHISLVGNLRPLSVPGADGFEQSLIGAWAAELGREVQLVKEHSQAEVWMGPLKDGLAYYQSEPAALARRKDRLNDLRKLRGGTFCIVEGSPHQTVFAKRFGATARTYPTSAHALVGLRHGHCLAVIEDRLLVERLVELPEWKGYAEVLDSFPELAITYRILAKDRALQSALQPLVDEAWLSQVHTEKWIDEVAFQAYVLSDTLDCH